MIKKSILTPVVILLAFVSFTISSCNKDEKEPDANTPNSYNLTLSTSEATPYQYINFELPEGKTPVNITAKYSEITVGTITTNAYRYEPENSKAGHYYFQVQIPEMPAGSQVITMKSPFGDLSATITVKALPVIANPDTYIKDFEDAEKLEREAIAKKYDDRVKAGNLPQSTADSLVDFSEKAAQKTKNYVAQLSAEEKKRYAYLLEANKSWITEYLTVINANPFTRKAEGDCEDLRQRADNSNALYPNNAMAQALYLQAEQCEAQRQQTRQVARGRFTARWDAAWEEAKTEKDNTPGKISGGWAFISTLATSASKGFLEEALGVKDLSDPFGLESLDEVSNKTAVIFEDGKATNLTAGVNVVNLSTNRAGFSPEFAAMLSSINEYNETMDNMGQFLPYAPEITVPSAQTVKRFVAGYTVDQISNPAIKVQYVDNDKGRQVKFTGEGINAPLTSFTFRITVASKFGTVSKIIDAELQLPMDKVLVGGSPWKVTYLNMDGQDQFQLHKLGNHFCNGVEYFDEYKINNATMSFTAAKGGSFISNGELHTHKMTDEGTSNCIYLGTEVVPENYNEALTWTFDANKNIVKIPELVNDDVDEYVASYQNNTLILKSLYVEIRLQKP